MSRKRQPIQTRSYMPLTPGCKVKVCLAELNDERRDYLASILRTAFLNALYAGKFRFWVENAPSVAEVFPDAE